MSSPDSNPAADRGGKHILIVEDHEDTARVMVMLLQRYGFTAQPVGSIAAALESARSGAFDLLISDMRLPDGSGIDLMRTLRAEGDIKGLCISGDSSDDDIARAKEAGFSEYLTKPLEMPVLLSAVCRLTGAAST